ncbi:MAG: glycerol-3-phosphate dehydrogenase subunit GlpB [Actinomycetota bacterium]
MNEGLERHYDVAVIGAGLAGLSAGLRLAESGKRTVVVAAGMGAIQLAPATIDVLGYAPERVTAPATALQDFATAHPEHPYARVPVEAIAASIEWFKERVGAVRYAGSLEANLVLPTALGAPKPTAVVPESMAGGDLRSGRALAIGGFRTLKDFYPAYLVGNLDGLSIEGAPDVAARAFEIDVPVHDADVTPLRLARLFDDAEFRKAVIADAHVKIHGAGAVGFPAVLGLEDPTTVWQELQDGLGRDVFEIPTLPPSVPGIRLFRSLKGALRQAGATLVMGGKVVGAETTARRVLAVVARSAARPIAYHAGHFVLASGGFASGGLEMDSRGDIKEVVFGLPLRAVPGRGERFKPQLLDRHPMATAGIATDDRLRPVDGGGNVVYENVFVAGATLAGAEPWREKSGDGISLATGHRAASQIIEEAT